MSLVTETLSRTYHEDAEQALIADALTRAVSDYLEVQLDHMLNFEKTYLNPQTCVPEWLDILSQWAGWGKYWDSTWSDDIKRKLLLNTNYLWKNRGNMDGLRKLFEIFNLDAKITPLSGFFLGVSTVPGFLNNDPFGYQITIPVTYKEGTPELMLVKTFERTFLPCWILIETRSA